MKPVLLLAKPFAALVVFATVTFHAARSPEPDGHTPPPGEHPAPTSAWLLPPEVNGSASGFDWFARPDLSGRGDPSSSSVGGYADASFWRLRAMALPYGRSDLLWSRLRLQDLPDAPVDWRPWYNGGFADDLPCDGRDDNTMALVDPGPVAEPAPDRAAQVLQHLAASLRLPAAHLTSAVNSGNGATATPPPVADSRVEPFVSPVWRTSAVNWDSLETAIKAQRLQELARALDSLIRTSREPDGSQEPDSAINPNTATP